MRRINTNVSSLIAQRAVQTNHNDLTTSRRRLSTALRINSGVDDPAGPIASQALKAEQTGVTTAIDSAGRATNIIGAAEGGLNEVSNLLNELQGLVNQSANSGELSQNEINANQLQVDSILTAINRIANSTSSLASGGANSLTSSSLATAQKILGVAYENISAANSAIEDTGFSQETANLTRAQILSQSATCRMPNADSNLRFAIFAP